MKYVFLDGESIESNALLHRAFHEALGFPGYYGNNLDALNDCITDMTEPVTVIAVHTQLLKERLGRRWTSFLRLMNDLEKKDAGFRFLAEPFDENGNSPAQI